MTYPTPQHTPVVKKKHTALWIVLGVLGGLVVTCLGIGAVVGVVGSSDKTPDPGTQTNVAAPRVVATSAPDLPAASPAIGDFKVAVKIIKKSCFGSAGCNVTYRIDPSYSGPDLSPDKTYEIVYRIKGGEDVQTNSFTFTGDMFTFDRDEFIGTKTSKSVLTAVVTEINELSS